MSKRGNLKIKINFNNIDLANLTSSQGFIVQASATGYAVSNAGDVNGDKINDILIGGEAGSYIVYGNKYGLNNMNFDIAPINITQGFKISGGNGWIGMSASGAGDVNGDGVDDVIVSNPQASPLNRGLLTGTSYVIYGKKNGVPNIDLNNLTSDQGFSIYGEHQIDNNDAFPVSKTGDVNGDGVDDIIVGLDCTSPIGRHYAGTSYIIFGSEDKISNIDLANFTYQQGFSVYGVNQGDYSGTAVGSGGDINGDGINDVIIGAFIASPLDRYRAGASYVVLGNKQGFNNNIDLANLESSQGFAIYGANKNSSLQDVSGWSVNNAGDVNHDGINDVIIGAPQIYTQGGMSSAAGISYVVFGNKQGFNSNIDLANLKSSQGFAIYGANEGDWSGWSVNTAGDINGDGVDDIIIGAWKASPFGRSSAGKSYVVFGNKEGFNSDIYLANLKNDQGFAIYGAKANDGSGYSVSGLGDINGDGINDIIIGAFNAGTSYVIFGSATSEFSSSSSTSVSSSSSSSSSSYSSSTVTSSSSSSSTGEGSSSTASSSSSSTGEAPFSPSVSMTCTDLKEGAVFDYVVIGTGPMSGPIIRRLVDAGHTVLALEKGPYFFPSAPDQKANGDAFDDTFQVYENAYQYPAPPFNVSRHSVMQVDALSYGIEEDNILLAFRERGYPYNQLQGFGGQTLTYGGLSLRPSPAAFDKWPNITFDEMLKWYMKSEASSWACGNVPTAPESHACGDFSGFMSVLLQDEKAYPKLVGAMPSFCAAGASGPNPLWLDTTNSTKIDYNGLYPTRAFCGPPQVFLNQTTASNGNLAYQRGSLQQTYLSYEYLQSHTSLLKVCVNTTVNRLILNEEATQVVGVSIENLGLTVTGGQFILASGARFSPQLLMSSGIGDSASLGALGVETNIHLPDVGRHFHDEWAFSLSFKITNTNAPAWTFTDSKLNRDQMHLIKWATGAQGNNFTDVQLYLRLANILSLDEYLPEFFQIGVSSPDSFAIRVALFQNDTFGPSSGVFPTGSNGLYVNRFKFYADMFGDVEKFDRFVQGAVSGYNKAMELVELLRTQSLNGETLDLSAIYSTAALITAANNGVQPFVDALWDWGNVLALHGGGTCGIGRVTDSNLKVYNLSNLYIADMSVFPYPVDANPTATLFALGERLAAHLLLPPNPPNNGWPSVFDLRSIDGTNGFIVNGLSMEDLLGSALSGGGDINGDGYADIVVAAPRRSLDGINTVGQAYVIFGHCRKHFVTPLDLNSLNGTNGFIINGLTAGGWFGKAVSIGDVNGDGKDDLVVTTERAGTAYVIFGAANFSGSFNLTNLNGSNGFTITGLATWISSINSVADVNDDGKKDIIIGAAGGGSGTGQVYTIFGTNIFSKTFDVSLLDGSNGFIVPGIYQNGFLGGAVTSGCDVNGDTIADVVIGAWQANNKFGQAYVIFGHSGSFANPFDLTSLNGSNGFTISGLAAGDYLGMSVGNLGDINGDSISDMMVGGMGKVYVIFGHNEIFPRAFDLSTLNGNNGFTINDPSTQLGRDSALSMAGDINGDGYDDIILGTGYASPNKLTVAGQAYAIFGHSGPFLNPFDLTTLDGSNGFTVNGQNSTSYLGSAISASRDMNGDGINDLIIGAHGMPPSHVSPQIGIIGKVYVIFGKSEDIIPSSTGMPSSSSTAVSSTGMSSSSSSSTESYFSSSSGLPSSSSSSMVNVISSTGASSSTDIDLRTLSMPIGFRIMGANSGDQNGQSISNAGDINNDGFADIIVSSWYASNLAGICYVIFGKADGFSDIDLSTLSMPIGFKILGAYANGRIGSSNSNGGDVNGDGYADIIIGEYNGYGSAGVNYVIFGKASGFSDIDLNSLSMPIGFKILAANSGDFLGYTVSNTGDINSDGYADIITASFNASPLERSGAGESYVIFGKASGFSDIDLNSLSMPIGFKILGANSGDRSGVSVSNAGDINEDGYADIIIGADSSSPLGRIGAGVSYVIFGKASGFSDIDLNSLSMPTGFKILGANSGDSTGWFVNNGGSINGDNVSDIIIAAQNASPLGRTNAGINYVIFGKTNGFSDIDLSNLSMPIGFKILGEYNNGYSRSVNIGKDINKDGYNDIVIGSFNASPLGRVSAGIGYIIFGKASGFNDIDLSVLSMPTGFRIFGANNADATGESVSCVGDVNGDGYADIVIGAYGASPLGRIGAGVSYVIFGSATSEFSSSSSIGVSSTSSSSSSSYSSSTVMLSSSSSSTDEGSSSAASSSSTMVSSSSSTGGAPGTIITHYEYAALSQYVYRDNQIKLPMSWETALSYKKPGYCIDGAKLFVPRCSYYADAYVKDEQLVVIAHRGSQNPVKNFNNWYENLFKLMDGKLTEYYSIALEFTEAVQKLAGKSGYTIVGYSGHSLGGHIAELMSATYGIKSVTFDSPGSLTVIQNYPNIFKISIPTLKSLITTYNAAPNLVNTMDSHPGTVYRMYPSYELKLFMGVNWQVFTLQQHGMLNIYQQFDKNTGVSRVIGNGYNIWEDGTPMIGTDKAVLISLCKSLFENAIAAAAICKGAAIAIRNTILNKMFYDKYNVNPDYWEERFDIQETSSDLRLSKIDGSLLLAEYSLGGITKKYSQLGMKIIGDNSGNKIWGTTNYADIVNSGSGNDNIWTFTGNDVVTDLGGYDTYHFYLHNMQGKHSIIDSDGKGEIYLENVFCALRGNFKIDKSDKSQYEFKPKDQKAANNKCDIKTLSGILGYNHKSDIFLLRLVNGDQDLQITYNSQNKKEFPYSKENAIYIKNFHQSDFGINLPGKFDDTAYYENEIDIIGTNGNNTISCSTAENSEVYGLIGYDTYVFFIGNNYNCSLMGNVFDPKVYKAALLPHNTKGLGIIEIVGFKPGDLLDLTSLNLTSFNDVGYEVVNKTTYLTLYNNQQITIDLAERDIVISIVNGTKFNPIDTGRVAVLEDDTYLSLITENDFPIEDIKCNFTNPFDINSSSSSTASYFSSSSSLSMSSSSTASYSSSTGMSNDDIYLSTLDMPEGFKILGENTGDSSGSSISSAGDINNDGYTDIIIGASRASSNAGKSYVIFGKASGFNEISLSNLTMPIGFKIVGESSGDGSGCSASSAGDINNDGFDDIIIGAGTASNWSGKSYVIFGKASGFSDITLSTLSMPDGFKILGDVGDLSGASVSSAGDINHDGFADIIIGAPYSSNYAGKSYIIFGKASGFSDITLSTLSMPVGFRIIGENSGDVSGAGVNSAGDINNDGFDDVIISAPYSSNYTGKSYVIFGKASGFSDITLSILNNTQGFRIIGEFSNDLCGTSISSAGDINNDKFDDIIVGARGASLGAGKSYMIFGKVSGFSDIELSALSMPTGFSITGEISNDRSGSSVSSAGDLNNDGFIDVLIGAPGALNNTGRSYVIFGKVSGFSDMNLSNLSNTLGIRIIGENNNDQSGASVSGAGDLNNDGFVDILIGAPGALNNAGKSYVIFGNGVVSSTGSSSSFTVISSSSSSSTVNVISSTDSSSSSSISSTGVSSSTGIQELSSSSSTGQNVGASCIMISEASSSKTAFFSYTIFQNGISTVLEKNDWNTGTTNPSCKIPKTKDKLSCSDKKGTYEIDKYAPSNAQGYYSILINEDIKNHIFSVSCSKFYWAILATGGMRNNVGSDDQQIFYTDIGKLFDTNLNICINATCKEINLKKAETIGGADEGYYAWLTLQKKHDLSCHISLDMGGETMQFSNGTKEGSVSWSLGKKATIGEIEVQRDLQPCYSNYNNIPDAVHYNGSHCRELINNYLDQGTYNFPNVTAMDYCAFFTISNFYLYFNDVCSTYLPYITKNNLPITTYTLDQIKYLCNKWGQGNSVLPLKISGYQNITDEVCNYWGNDWNTDVAPYSFARDICFSGNYNYLILKGFGLRDTDMADVDPEGEQIRVDQADWDYGAAKDLLDICITTNTPDFCYPYNDCNNIPDNNNQPGSNIAGIIAGSVVGGFAAGAIFVGGIVWYAKTHGWLHSDHLVSLQDYE